MTPAGLLTLALLAAPPADPRPALVELQLKGQLDVALAEVDRLLATEPGPSRSRGLDYLRARLLDRLGQEQEAASAFLKALTTTPSLAIYSYYHLALDNENGGHPETATALIARVLASPGDFPMVREAAELLQRNIAAGGDCRLLGGIGEARLPAEARRMVAVAKALCALRANDLAGARSQVAALLRESRSDEAAYLGALLAADRLVRREDADLARSVGLTLYAHREFARSSLFLDEALRADSLSPRDRFELGYARARNDFWLGSYEAASRAFFKLAEGAPTPTSEADALYQNARCRELLRDGTGASASYRRAYKADPQGEWGSVSLLAGIRVEWLGGRESDALELLDRLRLQRSVEDYLARALLFLISSDLVRGRADRAPAWIAEVERGGETSVSETAYWRGRLAELEGREAAAVAAYAQALQAGPYHPFALEARKRLARPELAPLAQNVGVALLSSGKDEDLRTAWLLLGEKSAKGKYALNLLAARLARDPQGAPFLRLDEIPVGDWPFWRQPIDSPEEILVALGLAGEGASAVERSFRLSQPPLAFTGARLLAHCGLVHRALAVVESLAGRLPASFPLRLLPQGLRELLHPLPYRQLINEKATQNRISPALVAAIIREESRFDPRALSDASARGLMQITQPLLRRLAPQLGRAEIPAQELYRPEIAIGVGTTHLGELARALGELDYAEIAAYNAGEDQARLWLGYCFSKDPAEFYSKVGFRQTRNYVLKVLTSQAHYQELYWSARLVTVSTNGGK